MPTIIKQMAVIFFLSCVTQKECTFLIYFKTKFNLRTVKSRFHGFPLSIRMQSFTDDYHFTNENKSHKSENLSI